MLQDGMVTPVGGNKAKKCNVRIVCATNRSLEEEVAAGNFRADLFYRINVLRIALKRETLDFLRQYRWPGNSRELQNKIERLVIMSGEDLEIGAELIDERTLQERAAGLVATGADFDTNTATLPEALAAVEKRMLSEA